MRRSKNRGFEERSDGESSTHHSSSGGDGDGVRTPSPPTVFSDSEVEHRKSGAKRRSRTLRVSTPVFGTIRRKMVSRRKMPPVSLADDGLGGEIHFCNGEAFFDCRADEQGALSPTFVAMSRLRADVGGVSVDPETDDEALLRFLVARDMNVRKAQDMIVKWRKWRKEFGVDDISFKDIAREHASGKGRLVGHNKLNQACIVCRNRFHDPKNRDVAEMIKFCVYMLREAVAASEAQGANQVCVLYDRRGMTMKNFDSQMFQLGKQLVNVVQSNYAERLGHCYIIGVTFFYWALYKVISPFLSARTKSKLHIISDLSELREHFDDDQLELISKELGGTYLKI